MLLRTALVGLAVLSLGCAAAPRVTRSPAAATATAATVAPSTAAPATPVPATPTLAPATLAPATSAPASASPRPAGPSPVAVQATLTDALRIEVAPAAFRVGVPVTFVVTNEGALIHEFYLGDAAAQDTHEADVIASGAEAPADSPSGIAVAAGQTEEITFVFDSAGDWIAGCHVRNHYAGGMRTTFTVTE